MPSITELFDLSNRTALVTGGSGWLGQAITEGLAEAGARVIVTSRLRRRADEAAERLPTTTGQDHVGIPLDHTDPASIIAGFDEAKQACREIDILVNNGLSSCEGDLTDVEFDAFSQHQRNNAGYFELARLLHDHAVNRGSPASIINIGSMYGEVGSYPHAYAGICSASSVAYHTLKGGTIQMTRHLAVYWAADNVRVNCISPGPFPNPVTAPKEMIQRLERQSPMNRMGAPWELKGAIVFLASDAASYVTGQNLKVDGGWTAW